VLESEFEIVKELLNNFHVVNINEKLKTFGQLENMVYKVFNLDDEDLTIKQK
jgi:hypothetical protein